MHTSGGHATTNVPISLKFSVDALSAVMMLIVTGIGFLIHLYATEYMWHDRTGTKGYARFFAYMNLFIFSMLVLVLGDNLPVLFVGWEGVGLCSYLLIGFWYDGMPNAAAGRKAFIANRVGDFGLICAMFLLAHYTGALDWAGIESGATSLVDPPTDAMRIHVWPIGGGQYTGVFSFLQPKHPFTVSAATACGLALLLGCTGKSAQIPLYVWLPDAMAGPTPVSALIHAATMVTAGVYLVCRLNFVFVLSPFVMTVIAVIGVLTALVAATIALAQNDIKKVLAYSTVSQLGFMFLGVGTYAFAAGFFHVFTHAFFKACLFLGAGSVIHAMHARIHDDDKAQDIRNMGGLRKYMPYTYWTFAVSTAAIVGFPLTSGFFSKDAILFHAYVNRPLHPLMERLTKLHNVPWMPPSWMPAALYAAACLAALMTAFYMGRVFLLTFWGDFRGWKIGKKKKGQDDHDLETPGPAPHESPWRMTMPLIVLATGAAVAGLFFNAEFAFHFTPMEHWLEPVFETSTATAMKVSDKAHGLEWPLALGGFAAFALGTGFAYWMYVMQAGRPAAQIAKNYPGLYKLVLDKLRVDELYEATVISAVDALADTSAAFDQWFVDGILAKLTSLLVTAFGTVLRAFQTGVVHVYAAVMVVGIAAIGWFFVAPHPDATITPSTSGDYTINAAPGMGYTYRWDADGNGQPDTAEFGDQAEQKIHLDPGKTQSVTLEVHNAFGLTRSKTFTVSRPAVPTFLEVGSNG
jgi:NADH-quinone oxidoreductase subunit L